MPELIKVGMADLKSGKNPDSIISYGLGSCVGIALYDSQAKVGGLAHIMLPDSTQARATDNVAHRRRLKPHFTEHVAGGVENGQPVGRLGLFALAGKQKFDV